MLTPKEQRVMAFIRAYVQSNGQAPLLSEIANRFEYRSLASVHEVLTILENKNVIKRVPNIARGIRLLTNGNDVDQAKEQQS